MFRAFVLYMLGPLGREALAFYMAHSLWINGLVVAYGALLALAHLNLRRLEARAVDVLRTSGLRPNALSDRAGPVVPWPEIIASASFFPLVAGRSSLIPRRCVPQTLDRLVPASRLANLLSERLGENAGKSEG